jgi:hypothetical protein
VSEAILESTLENYGWRFHREWGPFWVSTSVGYILTLDSAEDLQMKKTSNGGGSPAVWNDIAAARTGDFEKIAAWFDKWTPDNSGTKIHVVGFDKTGSPDTLEYWTFDTATDTWAQGTDVWTGTMNVAASSHECTVAVNRAGDVGVAFSYNITNPPIFKVSDDGGSTWDTRDTFTSDTPADHLMLFPAGGNNANEDFWLLRADKSADDVHVWLFDKSDTTDHADGTWVDETALTTDANIGDSYQSQWDAAIDPSSGKLYAAIWDDLGTIAADLDWWEIDHSGSAFTGATPHSEVYSNSSGDVGHSVAVVLAPSGDWYCVIFHGTSTIGGDVTQYSIKFVSGTTWGSKVQANDTSDDCRSMGRMRSCAAGGQLSIPFFNDDLNQLIICTNRQIELAASTDHTFENVTVTIGGVELGGYSPPLYDEETVVDADCGTGEHPFEVYWKNQTDGYAFFMGQNNIGLFYRKSTDKGATWGSRVAIFESANCVQNWNLWAGRWTPGSTEDKVFIVYANSSDKKIYFTYLDTTTDSLRASAVTVNTCTSAPNSLASSACSIALAESGRIYIAGWWNATGDRGTWYADKSTSPYWSSFSALGTDVTDQNVRVATGDNRSIMLRPAISSDGDDVFCYWWEGDETGPSGALKLKTWDNSLSSWGTHTIDASAPMCTVAASRWYSWGATIQHDTGDQWVTVVYNPTGSGTTHTQCVWKVSGPTTTTEKTKVIDGLDDDADVLHESHIYVDNFNGWLYGTHTIVEGGGSDGEIRYKISVDGGTNWGANDPDYDDDEYIFYLPSGHIHSGFCDNIMNVEALGATFMPLIYDTFVDDLIGSGMGRVFQSANRFIEVPVGSLALTGYTPLILKIINVIANTASAGSATAGAAATIAASASMGGDASQADTAQMAMSVSAALQGDASSSDAPTLDASESVAGSAAGSVSPAGALDILQTIAAQAGGSASSSIAITVPVSTSTGATSALALERSLELVAASTMAATASLGVTTVCDFIETFILLSNTGMSAAGASELAASFTAGATAALPLADALALQAVTTQAADAGLQASTAQMFVEVIAAAGDAGLTPAETADLVESLITLGNAGLSPAGVLGIWRAVTAAAAAGLAASGGLVYSSTVTTAANAATALSEQLDALVDVTGAASAEVVAQGVLGLLGAASMAAEDSLSPSADFSLAALAEAAASGSFPLADVAVLQVIVQTAANAGLSASGLRLLLETMVAAAQAGLTGSVVGDLVESLAVAADAGLSPQSILAGLASGLLAAEASATIAPGWSFSEALAASGSGSLEAVGGLVFVESFAAAADAGLTTDRLLELAASVLVEGNASQTAVALCELVAALSLSGDASVTLTDTLAGIAAAVFSADAALAAGVDAALVEALTHASEAGLSVSDTLSLSFAIALGAQGAAAATTLAEVVAIVAAEAQASQSVASLLAGAVAATHGATGSFVTSATLQALIDATANAVADAGVTANAVLEIVVAGALAATSPLTAAGALSLDQTVTAVADASLTTSALLAINQAVGVAADSGLSVTDVLEMAAVTALGGAASLTSTATVQGFVTGVMEASASAGLTASALLDAVATSAVAAGASVAPTGRIGASEALTIAAGASAAVIVEKIIETTAALASTGALAPSAVLSVVANAAMAGAAAQAVGAQADLVGAMTAASAASFPASVQQELAALASFVANASIEMTPQELAALLTALLTLRAATSGTVSTRPVANAAALLRAAVEALTNLEAAVDATTEVQPGVGADVKLNRQN